jgi:hypothetical protein
MRKGEHLEDPEVDGRIILKRIFKKWDGDIDWIDLAQHRTALVTVAIYIGVP